MTLEEKKREIIKRFNGKRNVLVVLLEGDSLLPEQEKALEEKGYRWQEKRVSANLSLQEQKELAEKLSNEVDIIVFTQNAPLPLVKLCAEATYEWSDPASGYGQKALTFLLLSNGTLV